MRDWLQKTFPSHSRFAKISLNLFMLVLSVVWLTPLWMMSVYASHSEDAIFSGQLILSHGDQFLTNYSRLQEVQNFVRAIINSVIVASAGTFFGLIVSSMAGYALARFKFVGARAMLAMIVFILAVPGIAIIIPEYVILVRYMGLSNTFAGVVLPYLANALGVFFMRQTFLSLPQEVMEAAYLDGASELRIFTRIALPLVRPAMASLAIILFLACWNDYLWPLLVLLVTEARTHNFFYSNFTFGKKSLQARQVYNSCYCPHSSKLKDSSVALQAEFMCYLVHKVPGGNSGPESVPRQSKVHQFFKKRSEARRAFFRKSTVKYY